MQIFQTKYDAMGKGDLKKERGFISDLRRSLLRFRAENNLTQAELAKRLGISRAIITAFETGVSMPREEALDAMVKLLRGFPCIAASRLRNLADYLDSPVGSERAKVEELSSFCRNLLAELVSIGLVEDDKRTP